LLYSVLEWVEVQETGATPFIAQLAKEMGVYTVAFVKKPFTFDRKKRADHAVEEITKLKQTVDQLTYISNDSILDKVDRNNPMHEAFKLVDQKILESVIESINDFNRSLLQR
jgi:cell division protein FtsZ